MQDSSGNSTPPSLISKDALAERVKNLKERVDEIKRDINTKASKEGLKAEVSNMKDEVLEAKSIAVKALDKPHECIQTSVIDNIKNNIQTFSEDIKEIAKDKRKTLYWAIGIVVMIAIPTIAAWIIMDRSVTKNTQSISAVQTDVDAIKIKQEQIPKEIKAEMKEQQTKYEKQLNAKTDLIIEAIKVRVEPRRRTRSTN